MGDGVGRTADDRSSGRRSPGQCSGLVPRGGCADLATGTDDLHGATSVTARSAVEASRRSRRCVARLAGRARRIGCWYEPSSQRR